MRRSVATIASLTLMVCVVAVGQETTGDVIGTVTSEDGMPLPGVTLAIEDPERGFERVVVCGPRGGYTLAALPPADYELTASLEGFRTVRRAVRVELGATVTSDIQMQVGAFTDTIEVTGDAPLVDVKSAVSGFTANTDELNAQLPISRDVTRVAMLAPGTINASRNISGANSMYNFAFHTPGQDVPVIAGASAAENGYIVNGLNTTSFLKMIGSSFVPMEFVEEVQVKTGGYEAEFGRSTGGVINLVTKSGTNSLRGGASVYWNPEELQENEPDIYQRDNEGNVNVLDYNSSEWSKALEVNASLGGPIVKDRLFLFGFVRYYDWSAVDLFEWWGGYAVLNESSDPYWGGKLDWNVTPAHRLEGTYLSDVVRVDETDFAYDPEADTLGEFLGDVYETRGGDNWAVKYSGVLSQQILLSAQVGVNPFDRSSGGSNDGCPVAYDVREGLWEPVGCWSVLLVGGHSDERVAYRADLDWFVGRHSLRAGLDAEANTTTADEEYSGGVYYSYWLNGTEGEPTDTYLFDHLPWDQDLVRVRHRSWGGSFDVLSNAAYVQDSWAVAPNLTLNLGLRWERFELKNAEGGTFMEVDDQVAPRLGAIWDIAGDGRSKLYGSVGIYHLAMSSAPAVRLAGGLFIDEAWYTLVGGINTDGSPEGLGDELDYDLLVGGSVPDYRTALDAEFDPMSQTELIVGYERLVGDTWSLGVRGVGRRFDEIIEDITIDKALYEVYGLEECYAEHCSDYVLTNPGSDFTGWYDLDGDGELDPIFFTSKELGYPDPERTYLAVELTARRRFANRWMLQGSYTWSHLYGNFDGLVNSDWGQDSPYLTATFDVAALMEHSSGDLPNDRRHNLKLFGAYMFGFGLQLSGNAWFRSGRPVNGFGMHPTDPWAQGSDYSFYNNGVPCPRGCGGRTDSVWELDLGVKYDWRWLGADWNVRVDAFNVINNANVELVDESAENEIGQPNPSYLMARAYQVPRRVRLGIGVSF